ncbi:MAG: hypothetical protein U1A78_26615 [Polyangia bacterium]
MQQPLQQQIAARAPAGAVGYRLIIPSARDPAGGGRPRLVPRKRKGAPPERAFWRLDPFQGPDVDPGQYPVVYVDAAAKEIPSASGARHIIEVWSFDAAAAPPRPAEPARTLAEEYEAEARVERLHRRDLVRGSEQKAHVQALSDVGKMRGLVAQSASSELVASTRLLETVNKTLELNTKFADAIAARLDQLRAPAPGLGQQIAEVITAVVQGGQALAMFGQLRAGAPGGPLQRPGPGGPGAPAALPPGVRADVAALDLLQQLPPAARGELAAALSDPDKREAFFAVLSERESALSPAGGQPGRDARGNQGVLAPDREGVPPGPPTG